MVVNIFDVICGCFKVVRSVIVFGDEDVVFGVVFEGFIEGNGGILLY